MPANPIPELFARDRGRDVLEWMAPIVADDIQRGVGMCTRDLRERPDQIRNMPTIEDRADVEHTSRRGMRWRRRDSAWNALRDDVNALRVDAQMFSNLSA